MKNLCLLGSTGSIGTSTLNVCRHLKDQFNIKALAAGRSIETLEEQAREFEPDLIAVYDQSAARTLQERLPHIPVLAGMDGLVSAARLDGVDMVVSAITGTRGIEPTLAAIEAGKDVGLANKEVLVSAGELVMRRCSERGVQLLPIDSEHSAIFQCLQGRGDNRARRLILTASGGPFRETPAEQLATLTVDQALRHPTWSMGPKITIDSSTLMNKGLEVIEARWLFDVPIENIEVVVHPQSVIHSMVEYQDGSIIAQMGYPSMELPIQYALTYPARKPSAMRPFDFQSYSMLTFEQPDSERFRCLGLAFDALREGNSLPCYMNAANEVLVERFLNREIAWTEIGHKLESLMQEHEQRTVADLTSILNVDAEARREALTS